MTDRREVPQGAVAESGDGWITWVRRGFFIAVGFWVFTLVLSLVVSLLVLFVISTIIAANV